MFRKPTGFSSSVFSYLFSCFLSCFLLSVYAAYRTKKLTSVGVSPFYKYFHNKRVHYKTKFGKVRKKSSRKSAKKSLKKRPKKLLEKVLTISTIKDILYRQSRMRLVTKVYSEHGGIAQLARAHGSYPWCREFKSPFRY